MRNLVNIIGSAASAGVSSLLAAENRALEQVIFQQGKKPVDAEFNLAQQIIAEKQRLMLKGLFGSGLAGLLSNPLGRIGSVFSSLFSANHAFAADPASKDAFGVTQYAYTTADINNIGNFQTFWNQNCVTGPLATYNESTNQLSFTQDWLSHQTQNDETMQAESNTTNPCGLIYASSISGGGLSNTGMLPAGSQNPDPVAPPDANTTP